VLSSRPDKIERGPIRMKLQSCDEDLQVITAQLSLFDFLNEPYPGISFTPGRYPALSWSGG
jgi:hypothetical protein